MFVRNLKDEANFKIAVMGEAKAGVGVTSLIKRFVNPYSIWPDSYVDYHSFSHHHFTLPTGNEVKLTIWDATEYMQEQRGSQGGIVAFDLTNRNSFEQIDNLIGKIKVLIRNYPIILVGTKSDLTDKIVITPEEIKIKSIQYGAPYIQVSAKTTANVNEAFILLTYRMFKRGSVFLDEQEYANDNFYKALQAEIDKINASTLGEKSLRDTKVNALSELMRRISCSTTPNLQEIITEFKALHANNNETYYDVICAPRRTGLLAMFNPAQTNAQKLIDSYLNSTPTTKKQGSLTI